MNPKYVWQITFCPTVSLIISRLLSIFKAALENIYLLKKKNQEESLFSITDGKELITCKSGVTSISLNLYSFSTNFKIGCRIS